MRIHEVMSKDVATISPDVRVAVAREQLRVQEIRHLVVTEKKKVVGVVSDHDLADCADDTLVRDVMTTRVLTIAHDETLRKAAALLAGHNIGCLPVFRDGNLAGIVTTSDLLRLLAKGATRPAPQSERVILRKRGPRKRQLTV